MQEMGVQAVRMNAIARHAGISPVSLYQYFPGKDAIVEELSRRLVGQLHQMTWRVTRTGSRPARSTPETTLDRLLEAAMLLAREHPAFLPSLAATTDGEPSTLFEALTRSLPSIDVPHAEDAVRSLATRIFCAGIGLVVQQSAPAVHAALLLRTRQAVLSRLQAPENPEAFRCSTDGEPY
ncbi:TetR/AcrR family transcriptional regulator [Streptomyces viridiviolaceus]